MRSDDFLGRKIRYGDEIGEVEQVSQGGLVWWATVRLQAPTGDAPRVIRVPQTEWLKFETLPDH